MDGNSLNVNDNIENKDAAFFDPKQGQGGSSPDNAPLPSHRSFPDFPLGVITSTPWRMSAAP